MGFFSLDVLYAPRLPDLLVKIVRIVFEILRYVIIDVTQRANVTFLTAED